MKTNNEHFEEYKKIPGNTWIEKLRFAFIEAAGGKKGKDLTLDQWVNSRLRYIISDIPLTDEEMINYFDSIDANVDRQLSWDEVVGFLLIKSKSTKQDFGKQFEVTCRRPTEYEIPSKKRTSNVTRIHMIAKTEEILCLTETALTFYDAQTCKVNRVFNDRDMSDFCVMSQMSKIAIIKKSRQLQFIDIATCQKTPYLLSPTVEPTKLSSMSIEESVKMQHRNHNQIPLYDPPTAICCSPTKNIIFSGDTKGRIDALEFIIENGVWNTIKLSSIKPHNLTVSKIKYIESLDCYASSSIDSTISLWNIGANKNLEIIKIHKFSSGTAIINFEFDPITQNFFFQTTAHCFGIWKANAQVDQAVSTDTWLISTMANVTLSCSKSYLLIVTTDLFLVVYKAPQYTICHNSFMGLQHEFQPPSVSLVLGTKIFFCGAFLSQWTFELCHRTNKVSPYPLIFATINLLFDRVITIDTKGIFTSWNMETGSRDFVANLNLHKESILSACSDVSNRRIVVSLSDGSVIIISANSGQILEQLSSDQFPGGVSKVRFYNLFETSRLVCVHKGNVTLFDDLQGNKLSFIRNLKDHTGDVNCIAPIKSKYIVTSTTTNELFMWQPSRTAPMIRFNFNSYITSICDIEETEDMFLTGDEDGMVHLMHFDASYPIRSFNPFQMVMASGVTFIVRVSKFYAFVNYHGYVKIMNLDLGSLELKEVVFFRAHTTTVKNICYSEERDVLMTVGSDDSVRFFKIFEKKPKFACSLGSAKQWFLTIPEKWQETEAVARVEPLNFANSEIRKTISQMLLVQQPKPIRQEKEEKEENSEKEKENEEEVEMLPPFDAMKIKMMLEEAEFASRKKPPPLSARSPRIVKPKPLNPSNSLIDNRMMKSTARFVTAVRNIAPRRMDRTRFGLDPLPPTQ